MATARKPAWYFYAAWVILTLLCIPIALVFYLLIIRVVERVVGDYIYVDGVRHITEDYLLPHIFFPSVSLLTGLVQYGLLRRYLPRMGWWVLATAMGWLMGFVVLSFSRGGAITFFRMVDVTNAPWAIDPAFIVMGLSIGVGQWLLLRRRLPHAGWWIVANVVGWGLVLPITGKSLNQLDLLALGLPACATALALALLMNQTPPPQHSTQLKADF